MNLGRIFARRLHYDVCIVGGGIMGSSSAYFLANKIAPSSIRVVERDATVRAWEWQCNKNKKSFVLCTVRASVDRLVGGKHSPTVQRTGKRSNVAIRKRISEERRRAFERGRERRVRSSRRMGRVSVPRDVSRRAKNARKSRRAKVIVTWTRPHTER